MKHHWPGILLALTSLVFGALLYSITRSDNILLLQWLSKMNEGKLLHFFQQSIHNQDIPAWVIYSLPDALWMFSLVLVILMIWNFQLNRQSISWIAIAVFTGILFEIFQMFHFLPGTFDVTDLLLMLISAILPVSFMTINYKTCKRE
jgi:hypothetical protein